MKITQVVSGVLVLGFCVACGDTSTTQPIAPGAAGNQSSGGSNDTGFGGAVQNASGAGQGGNASSATFDDFLHRYVEATCKMLARCVPAFVPTLDSCEDAFLAAPGVALQSQAIADGRVGYYPDRLPACVAFLESAACDEVTYAPCRGVFEGKTAPGKACTLDLECAGNGQCLVSGACPGVCGAAAKLGEPCTRYNECEPGLVCAGATAAMTCQATAKIGEACDAELRCSGYAVCADGTCASRESLGQSEQGGPCDALTGPSCKPGLVCTTALQAGVVVGQCQPKVASGASCTYSTPDPCPNGEYCHITSDTGVKPATGTCQSAPKLGEQCRYGEYNFTTCDSGQFCDVTGTNVCSAKREVGATCPSGTACASGACVNGHCVESLECERSKDSTLQ